MPVRACELVKVLCADRDALGIDGPTFRQVARALQDIIEQEAASFAAQTADLYSVFNPDRDTAPVVPLEKLRTEKSRRGLVERMDYLLEKGNFEHLSDVQVEAAIKTANVYGLRVRLKPERVESLAVWVRGRGSKEVTRRTWRNPINGETTKVAVFRRLAVVCQLKDDPHIILKLFKEIPETDVEALLPHAEVEMSLLDRLMVWGGGAGALGGAASKSLGVISGAVQIWNFMWVLLVGLGTLAFRTFMGFRRARDTRDSQRTRHLYFQNLSNNGAVIHTLIGMIAQEELKEALLAYAFCYAPNGRFASRDALDRHVETWLHERFGTRVDFDLEDGLETLTRLGLWADAEALQVVDGATAIERLKAHWVCQRSRHYHRERTPAFGGAPDLGATCGGDELE